MSASNSVAAGRVFISYRREDSAYPAGWLFDRLVDGIGQGRVFKDVDSIQLGEDFCEKITTAVESSTVLLAVIGTRWLGIRGKDGRLRLDDPQDFVRVEIETALKSQIWIIPVLVDGARMPAITDLPQGLQQLARLQGMALSPERFGTDTGRLLAVLDQSLASQPTEDSAWHRMPVLVREWLLKPPQPDTLSVVSHGQPEGRAIRIARAAHTLENDEDLIAAWHFERPRLFSSEPSGLVFTSRGIRIFERKNRSDFRMDVSYRDFNDFTFSYKMRKEWRKTSTYGGNKIEIYTLLIDGPSNWELSRPDKDIKYIVDDLNYIKRIIAG